VNFLVFLGSVRDSAPPRPRRLGARVAAAGAAHLRGKGHGAEIVDPLTLDLPRPFKPHFAMRRAARPSRWSGWATPSTPQKAT